MKAQVIRSFGAPDVFEVAELPTPTAGPGQVVVKQAATSVNPVDYKSRQTERPISPPLPAVLGCDVAGTIVEEGDGVDGFKVGDAVYGCAGGVRGMNGALAEYIATDPRLLALKPASLSLHEAAALPLVTITAWEGLYDRAKLEAGQTVLIHGGAGGVGHIAIQLAKARRAQVYATVSSEKKAEIARGFGADETIDYRTESVADYVTRCTGGRGFDVVFDATGGSAIATSFEAARLNGQVITIVASYEADLTLMHVKGLSLHVVFMLIPMLHDIGREHHGWILTEAAKLVDAGKLKPLLDEERFTLDRIAEAHRRLEEGKALGKVVVDIAADG